MDSMILEWIDNSNLQSTKQLRRKKEFIHKCYLFVHLLEGKILSSYSTHAKSTAKVQLGSKELSKEIGSNPGIGYRKVITCLTELSVICSGSSYEVGKFAKSYWFGGTYHHIEHTVNLLHNKYNEKELYIYSCIKKLNFDLEKIQTYLANIEVNSASNYNALILNYFKSGKIFVKQDIAKRLHSNLTMLPKRYRSIVSLEGKHLGDVDLANAQPFLLIPFANQHNLVLDTNFIEDACKGNLYKTILNEIEREGTLFSINSLKKQLFTFLFFSDKTPTRNYKGLKAFERLYPLTYQTIFSLKDLFGNSGFAIQLQTLESQLMNTTIEKLKAKYLNGIYLRFHDAILCRQELQTTVQKEIQETALELFKVFPKCNISQFKSD